METTPRGNMLPYAVYVKGGIIPSDLVPRIKKFLHEMFGEGGFGNPDRRWVFDYEHGYLAFKTEADRMMFVTAWSGYFDKDEE